MLLEDEVRPGELPEAEVDHLGEQEEPHAALHEAAASQDQEVLREEAASAHGDVGGIRLQELGRGKRGDASTAPAWRLGYP